MCCSKHWTWSLFDSLIVDYYPFPHDQCCEKMMVHSEQQSQKCYQCSCPLYFQFDVFSVSDSSTRSIDSNTLVWFVRSSGWTVFKMEKQSNVHLSIVNNVTHINRNPRPVLHMLPNRWLSENFSTPWIIHPLFLFAPFLSWRNS